MRLLRTMSDLVNALQVVKNSTKQDFVPGALQTKDWRTSQQWYIDGRHNECELFQRTQVETIVKQRCIKTDMRFNTDTYELRTKLRPLDDINGFEWTEDFDGLSIVGNKKFYFNLKFICDAGGAQTRSLREVYHYVNCQLQFFDHPQSEETHDATNIYFINILDGNTCAKHMEKFHYLIKKEKYSIQSGNVFVGDMYTFNEWFLERDF